MDPIAALLFQQNLERFQRDKYPGGEPVSQPAMYQQGLNAMRDWLMPYIRNNPWLYQPTDVPTNAMILGAHPMQAKEFTNGKLEGPPEFYGYYDATARHTYR